MQTDMRQTQVQREDAQDRRTWRMTTCRPQIRKRPNKKIYIARMSMDPEIDSLDIRRMSTEIDSFKRCQNEQEERQDYIM